MSSRTIAINVDIEKIFSEKENVTKLYNEVRNSDIVKQCYSYMLQTVISVVGEIPMAKEILENEEVIQDNEKIIKERLVCMALQKVINERVKDWNLALISVITQENVLGILDELEEILQTTIREFLS